MPAQTAARTPTGSLAGLRRFTGPAPAASRAGAASAAAGRVPDGRDAEERCELCGVALGPRHGHVVELDQRSLRCACRACYLLFTRDGAGGGRWRAVPDRYLTDPAHRLTSADWDELRIPVTTAFFFTNSDLARVVACYPSPAGATECLLDLARWAQLRQAYPLLAAPLPDVEAVYVTGVPDELDAFVVPIDACYALVGEIRLHWRGLDGGAEVRRILAGFLADLRARSRPLVSGGDPR